MKFKDIKEGMKVGFTYDGIKHIGKVIELYATTDTRTNKSIFYAQVETPERVIDVRVSRLLGLL